jgi:flavin-dependent dehydrogenase
VHKTRNNDAIVVGAGPAGALAARCLAAKGVSVLLVDEARFPRWKVCGCCLNGAALRVLDNVGLSKLPERLGARRLTHARMCARGHTAELNLPNGVALSRERFDEALLHEAIKAGAEFRSETTAAWIGASPEQADIELKSPNTVGAVRARIVIAADGLAAAFTRRIPGVRHAPARRARIGAGTTLADAPRDYGPNIIHMAIGSGGYVGIVRLEDERLNVAAALGVDYVRSLRGLAAAATHIIEESGLPSIPALRNHRWQGTPPLTRRYEPPPSTPLFLIGDAAEYVEPFTGEGMAWALISGATVVEHVVAALNGAGPAAQAAWRRHSRSLLGWRKRRCRWIARALRHPRLTALSVRLLSARPQLAGPYVRALNRPALACD